MLTSIAISVNVFQQRGGVESYALDLIRQFAQRGIKVTVYASKFDSNIPEYQYIDPVLVNLKHIPKPLRGFWFSRQLKKIRRNNEKLISCNLSDDADIMLCGGNHLGYLDAIQKLPSLRDRLLIHRNYSCYNSAKIIMAHSEQMKQELINFYNISSEKIVTIYPPVDETRFSSTVTTLPLYLKDSRFDQQDIVFLFPSTGHQRKGLFLLADYFQKTNLPIKLAVVGEKLPYVMKNVIELGFCTDMPALYRSVDYTILASAYEPFGLIGVESILSGTKVVLANNIACCEVMNEQAGFFFSRNSKLSLDKAIKQAIALKRQNNHKIQSPNQALTYDCSVKSHIDKLCRLLM